MLTKKKKHILLFCLLGLIIGIILMVSIAYSKSPAQRVKKQLALGDRYLQELKYEQAIVTYAAVIEIEENNKAAWQKMGEIFLALTEHNIDLNQRVITFSKYTGEEKEIWIPSIIEVDGIFYSVYVDSGLFSNCGTIKKVVIQKGVSTTQDASDMFHMCRSLEELDLEGLDTSKAITMENMFSGCCSLHHLDVSNFDTQNVTNMYGMFGGGDIRWHTETTSYDFSEGVDEEVLQKVFGGDVHYKISLADSSDILIEGGCYNLEELDLSNFNTSNVTDMSYMFQGMRAVNKMDLSSFDTSNVKDMSGMFSMGMNFPTSCLQEINISSFNTSNVKSMRFMFFGCEGLTKLDVSCFDTSKVTDMGHMFQNCKTIQELDVSGFNTKNVENIELMFDGCGSLKDIDVNSFNTSRVLYMQAVFRDCSSLRKINVDNWDTKNVQDMMELFKGCKSLEELDLKKWNFQNLEYVHGMFEECESLRVINVPNTVTMPKLNQHESIPEELLR